MNYHQHMHLHKIIINACLPARTPQDVSTRTIILPHYNRAYPHPDLFLHHHSHTRLRAPLLPFRYSRTSLSIHHFSLIHTSRSRCTIFHFFALSKVSATPYQSPILNGRFSPVHHLVTGSNSSCFEARACSRSVPTPIEYEFFQ